MTSKYSGSRSQSIRLSQKGQLPMCQAYVSIKPRSRTPECSHITHLCLLAGIFFDPFQPGHSVASVPVGVTRSIPYILGTLCSSVFPVCLSYYHVANYVSSNILVVCSISCGHNCIPS